MFSRAFKISERDKKKRQAESCYFYLFSFYFCPIWSNWKSPWENNNKKVLTTICFKAIVKITGTGLSNSYKIFIHLCAFLLCSHFPPGVSINEVMHFLTKPSSRNLLRELKSILGGFNTLNILLAAANKIIFYENLLISFRENQDITKNESICCT